MNRPCWPRRPRADIDLVLVVLGFLLLLGMAVRVRHLTSSPGWFRDEGVYMEVAWNAVQGDARLGPLNHTWVSPFQTHPPLHSLTSGLWMHVLGAMRGDYRQNIQVFRWFSVACGIAAIGLTFLLGLGLGSALLALLAVAFLCFDPWTVMYHRMGLPYNLLAVEVMLTAWLAHRYFGKPALGRLALAVLAASTAPVTVYYGIAVPAALFVALAVHGRRRDLWMPPLALLPLAAFLILLWTIRPPGLAEDWAEFRADAAGTWSLADWAQDFLDLMRVSPLIPLGLVGLALLPRRPVCTLLQVFVALYLFLWLRRFGNHIWLHRADLDPPTHMPLITYPTIPLLAPLALGLSALLLAAWRHLRGDALGGQAPAGSLRLRAVTAIWGVCLAITFVFILSSTLRAIRSAAPHTPNVPPDRWGFQSPLAHDLAIEKWEAEGTLDAPGVSPFLHQQQIAEDDLIIAEYPLWWTLPGRHASLPMAIVYLGGRSEFFTYPISQDRFAHDSNWRHARFIVLDEMTRRWRAEFDPEILAAVREIESHWREVHRVGRLSVYAPPADTMAEMVEITPDIASPELAVPF